jgi:hypothetical protein
VACPGAGLVSGGRAGGGEEEEAVGGRKRPVLLLLVVVRSEPGKEPVVPFGRKSELIVWN